MDHVRKILRIFIWCLIDILIIIVVAAAILIIHIESDLPDASVLKTVKMQVPLRVYAADDTLIGEYGEKRRNPVPYSAIPPLLVDAVLATEDQRFFEHPGVDFKGLMRAGVQLALTGTKSQGGSTITMQVARNFFLSPEKTYTRKLKEILLAMKIERVLSKQKILDLYLNKIYFGNRAYGVAAAAQAYYGKPLSQLTLPELAVLAGLPKAPSALNPITHPVAALERRNHVLERMLDHHYIDEVTYRESIATPITAAAHESQVSSIAPYVAEMARNAMVNQFGEEEAYTSGFRVYTTLNVRLQKDANSALRDAVLAYDKRHGYRGAFAHVAHFSLPLSPDLSERLKKLPQTDSLRPAFVTQVSPDSITVMTADSKQLTIPWAGLSWARRALANGRYVSREPSNALDVARVGDLVYVLQTAQGAWRLSQYPKVEAALIALSPKDGAILALVGGFNFSQSKFNRVIQAQRQPGSSFKPFIYAAALAKGLTLATMINDAPISLTMPDGSVWQPQNANRKFYGPTRLRVGLTKSRNLVSVRLLQLLGIKSTIRYLENFGFSPKTLPAAPSLALGTASITPLELASGYLVLASGGYQIKPYFINKIVNEDDITVYQAEPAVACEHCLAEDQWQADGGNWVNPDEIQGNDAQSWTVPTAADEIENPNLLEQQPNEAPPQNMAAFAISPQIAYLINSVLQDVIRHGTGRGALSLERTDLAGKTGTTNEQRDAWFAGYNGDIVTVTWMGYDQPQSLYEYGAQAALPMWVNFMGKALQGKPPHSLPEPPGIVTMRIDPRTGYLTTAGDKSGILELFLANHIPSEYPQNTSWQDPDQSSQENNVVEGIFHFF